MVKNDTKSNHYLYLIIFILCALFVPYCVSAQCGECDDKNPCTKDYCNGTQCLHMPSSCDNGSSLTWRTFGISNGKNTVEIIKNTSNSDGVPSASSIAYASVSCDDGNACTTDSYSSNGCIHDPVNCDYGGASTVDMWSSCGCANTQLNDNENASVPEPQEAGISVVQTEMQFDNVGENATGSVSQSESKSVSIEMSCTDSNPCTTDSYNGTACIYELENCDDGNSSTLDYCIDGDCINEPLIVGSENNNTFELVSQEFSARRPPNCDDNDPCTNDTFNGKACVHTPRDCDDKNATTFDYCFEGNCVHVLTSCDDDNACTTDSFNGTACVHAPKNCDDKKPCTTDSCDQVSGCKHVSKNCDDGNRCTIDYCDGEGKCVHKQRNCDDDNPCTVDYCDRACGCVHMPTVCGQGKTCIDGFCEYLYAEPYSSYNSGLPTKSYAIPAGTAITLPWGSRVAALDTLKVENGIAYSSASPLRFVEQLGQNQVTLEYQSSLKISDRAEMIGLSWQGNPFTLTVTQPDGSLLPQKGDDENVLHLKGLNYDYYFLRSAANGDWNIEIRPTNPGTSGEGFSLITGLVNGVVPPGQS